MLQKYIAQNIPIAIDFDGCIAIGEHVKIKYAKIYHKIDITPRSCMSDTYPLGSVMYKQLMDKVIVLHTDEYTLDPHCKEVLEQLSQQGFMFHIITSRHDNQMETCKQFTKKHKLLIMNVYGTSDGPKERICKKMHVRAIIDDTLKKLLPLTEAPMHLFFLQREWNTHEQVNGELKKRIQAISDWREFAIGLGEMKQMHEAICYYKDWINSDTNIKEITELIRKDPFLAQQCVREYKRK